MLQQTQVKTVIPFLRILLKKFQILMPFLKYNDRKVNEVLGGFRILFKSQKLKKNFTAKKIIKEFNGKLPNNIEAIKNFTWHR